MSVTFLGHAGLSLQAPAFRLLMDPWFAETGAFLGAWHQFPRNDHLDQQELLDADWVAISHEHLDHLDATVVARLPQRTRVVIPAYPSTAVRDRLTAAGARRVIELQPWQPFPLDHAGSWIVAIPEQSPMCHDAAFLVYSGGQSVLNCNDARLTNAQARRASLLAGGRLDLMTVQGSGASWHPLCYVYPDQVRRAIEARKRESKLRAVYRLVRATGPRLAVPFAGPPCFLDPELRKHNDSIRPPGIFPDAEQATAWLCEHLPTQRWACFRPGDRLALDDLQVERDATSASFSYSDDLDAYLDEYAADRKAALESLLEQYTEPDHSLADLFVEHFTGLGELSPWFLERIGMTMRFDVLGPHGGRWDVSMGERGLHIDLRARAHRPDYTLSVEGRWLQPVLSGAMPWEELFLSLRFTAQRDPDIYNDYLFGLLKHANRPALRAVEDYEALHAGGDERITVASDGVAYSIGRMCPHAGEDLGEGAVVEAGVIRCLGHNFEFDLATGRCLNARCRPLDVERLGPLSD